MRKKLKILVAVIFFICNFWQPENIKATETEDTVGYSVQAILPDMQRDTGVSYFDLLLEPKDSEVLQVKIFNHEDSDITVNVTPTTASTNQNGLIVYEGQESFDESLQYPIEELVSMDSYSVKVPASESKVVDIRIDMPEDAYKGFLLGGLRFEKEQDENSQNEESVQINNQYAYVIGLQVTQDEDQEVTSNLNLTGIEPSLVNYRTAVVVKLQNDQPFILGEVDINAEVYESDQQEPIKTATLEAANFAPSSTMEFVIDWENQYLEPGDYRLKLTATNDDNEWSWDEAFTITDDQAQISDDAVELESRWFTPQLFIGIIVLLVIIIFVLLVMLKKRKK